MSKHNKEGLVKVQDPISGKCYFYDFIPTGRINRMRTRRESRYVNLAKRVGKRAYSFNSDFCSNLTRWNRH